MKFSMTLIFSLLFLVVLVAYLNMDRSTPPGEEAFETSSRVLALAAEDEMTGIQIQKLDEKQTISLEKVKDEWMIRHPVTAVADPRMVQGLIMSLKLSPKVRRLEPEKDWEEYGLKKPSLKIGVNTKNGDKRLYLNIGNINPSGENVFARWEGENEYFLMAPEVKEAFSQTVYSLRWKRIFRMPHENIAKVHIHIDGTDYELSQHQGNWFWMEPILLLGNVLDAKEVAPMVNRIEELNIKEFLDENPPNPSECGFTIKGDSVRLTSENSNEETLEIGKEVPLKDAFYGRKSGSPEIFLLSKTTLKDWAEDVEKLAGELIEKEKNDKKPSPNAT